MMKLKERIIRLMIAQTGMTVTAWGEKNGFPQTTLSNWITGTRNIKPANLEKLAAALGCKPMDIATVEITYTGEGISELEADREEISALFGELNKPQRKSIIKVADLMVEGNRKQEELENL